MAMTKFKVGQTVRYNERGGRPWFTFGKEYKVCKIEDECAYVKDDEDGIWHILDGEWELVDTPEFNSDRYLVLNHDNYDVSTYPTREYAFEHAKALALEGGNISIYTMISTAKVVFTDIT